MATPVLRFTAEPGGAFPLILTNPLMGEWAKRPSGGPQMLVLRGRRDVLTSISDTRTFAMAGVTPAGKLTGCPLTGAEMQSPDGGLLNMNPPALRAYRLRIAHLFTTRQAERTRPAVTLLARHLAGTLPAGQVVDVLARYAEPFTAAAVSAAMGTPLADWDRVLEWSRIAFGVVPSPAAVPQVAAAWQSLYAYYEPLVARKLAQPDGSLTSGIAAALDGWATPAQTAHVVATVSNGFGAILPVLAVSLTELTGHPFTAAAVGRSRTAAAAAGDRLLQTRAMFPVALPRVTLAGVRLSGRHVPAGTVVLPSLIGAARDTDTTMKAPCSLPFAPGPHLCPGDALTRVWLHTALGEFFARWPAARLTGRLAWQPGTLSVPREIRMILAAH